MAQAGSNDEKTEGIKSRWTVPLMHVYYKSLTTPCWSIVVDHTDTTITMQTSRINCEGLSLTLKKQSVYICMKFVIRLV